MEPPVIFTRYLDRETFIVPGIGMCSVLEICPSGAWVMAGYDGRVWLIDRPTVATMCNRRANDAETREVS
jgi:hypothetical protein